MKNFLALGSKADHRPITLGCYILDGTGKPVHEPDFVRWTLWLQTNSRVVARDEIAHDFGPVQVRTIFLGLAHHFTDSGRPALWEALLVYAPPPSLAMGVRIPDVRLEEHHYTSRKAALLRHTQLVQSARAGRFDLLLHRCLAGSSHPS